MVGATSCSKRKFSWGEKKNSFLSYYCIYQSTRTAVRCEKVGFTCAHRPKKKKLRYCHHYHAGVEILWPLLFGALGNMLLYFSLPRHQLLLFCELTQRRNTVEKEQILYLDPNTKVEQIHSNHSPHWGNIWHMVGLTLGAHMGEWQNLPSDLE